MSFCWDRVTSWELYVSSIPNKVSGSCAEELGNRSKNAFSKDSTSPITTKSSTWKKMKDFLSSWMNRHGSAVDWLNFISLNHKVRVSHQFFGACLRPYKDFGPFFYILQVFWCRFPPSVVQIRRHFLRQTVEFSLDPLRLKAPARAHFSNLTQRWLDSNHQIRFVIDGSSINRCRLHPFFFPQPRQDFLKIKYRRQDSQVHLDRSRTPDYHFLPFYQSPSLFSLSIATSRCLFSSLSLFFSLWLLSNSLIFLSFSVCFWKTFLRLILKVLIIHIFFPSHLVVCRVLSSLSQSSLMLILSHFFFFCLSLVLVLQQSNLRSFTINSRINRSTLINHKLRTKHYLNHDGSR